MRQTRVAIYLCLLATSFHAIFSAPREPAPADLTLKDQAGKAVRLRALRGKPVVLNFWATWCLPCREEMPLFVEAEKKWAAKGVVFVAVSLDDRTTRKDIPAFLQKFNIGFPVWMGATGDDLFHLGMGEAVPATAFLNEQGVIVARVQGEIHGPEMEQRLAWLTGDRSGPVPNPLIGNLSPSAP